MYYRLYDTQFHTSTYWHGSPARSSFLLTLGQLVIPIGTRKPRNVSRETIKEF